MSMHMSMSTRMSFQSEEARGGSKVWSRAGCPFFCEIPQEPVTQDQLNVCTYIHIQITIYLFIYPSICLSIYLSESIKVLLAIVFDYNPSQCVGSDLSPSFCVRRCCLPTTFKITPTKQMLASLGFSSSK